LIYWATRTQPNFIRQEIRISRIGQRFK